MNMTVTLTATPELLSVLANLTNAFLPKTVVSTESKTIQLIETSKADPVQDTPKEQTMTTNSPAAQTENAQPGPTNPAIDFTTLRAEFASRLKAGKTTELQAILQKFQVEKITQLTPDQYEEAYRLVSEV